MKIVARIKPVQDNLEQLDRFRIRLLGGVA